MADILSTTESLAGTLQSEASLEGKLSSGGVTGELVSSSEIDAVLSTGNTLSGDVSTNEEWSMSLTPAKTLNATLTLPPTRAGGTNDYEELINKPKINSVTLIRDKSFEDLGLTGLTNLELEALLT